MSEHVALVAVSIGDPAIITGGNAFLSYGGIIAGIAASLLAWWYVSHRGKAQDKREPSTG
jgi:hypothetical protein